MEATISSENEVEQLLTNLSFGDAVDVAGVAEYAADGMVFFSSKARELFFTKTK